MGLQAGRAPAPSAPPDPGAIVNPNPNPSPQVEQPVAPPVRSACLDVPAIRRTMVDSIQADTHCVIIARSPETGESKIFIVKLRPPTNVRDTNAWCNDRDWDEVGRYRCEVGDPEKPGEEDLALVKQRVLEAYPDLKGQLDGVTAVGTAATFGTNPKAKAIAAMNVGSDRYGVVAIRPISWLGSGGQITPGAPISTARADGRETALPGGTKVKVLRDPDRDCGELDSPSEFSVVVEGNGRKIREIPIKHPIQAYASGGKRVVDVTVDPEPSYDPESGRRKLEINITYRDASGSLSKGKGIFLELDDSYAICGGRDRERTENLPDLRPSFGISHRPQVADPVTPVEPGATTGPVTTLPQERPAFDPKFKREQEEKQRQEMQQRYTPARQTFARQLEAFGRSVFASATPEGAYTFADGPAKGTATKYPVHAVFTPAGCWMDWWKTHDSPVGQGNPYGVTYNPKAVADALGAVGFPDPKPENGAVRDAIVSARVIDEPGKGTAYLFPFTAKFTSQGVEVPQQGVLFMDQRNLPPEVAAAYGAARTQGGADGRPGELATRKWLQIGSTDWAWVEPDGGVYYAKGLGGQPGNGAKVELYDPLKMIRGTALHQSKTYVRGYKPMNETRDADYWLPQAATWDGSKFNLERAQ